MAYMYEGRTSRWRGESKHAERVHGGVGRDGRSATESTLTSTATAATSKSLDGTIAELKRHHEEAEHYKRTVLENVIDMFIRFEKRKPTNMELADLTVEVSDSVLYDEALADQVLHDDEFTDLIQKLSAPIETHDRVEKRLHEWLVEETRDLQLRFRTQAHFRELQDREEKEAMETIVEETSAEEEEAGDRGPSGAPTNIRQDSPLKMKRERTSSEQLVLVV